MRKRVFSALAAVILLLAAALTCFAADAPHLADHAGLLNGTEAERIEQRLEQLCRERQFDVVIVTTDALDGKSPMAYADDYFDYNGYGQGTERDGCLLLIHMDADRGYWISTRGAGIRLLRDRDIDQIGEALVPILRQGSYAAAFDRFTDEVEARLDPTAAGSNGSLAEQTAGFFRNIQGKHLIIGGVIGLFVAFMILSALKKQLRSVAPKASAGDYFVPGSLQMKGGYDHIVGRFVSRTPRQSDSSSSTHTGSSGASHGGGGGSF